MPECIIRPLDTSDQTWVKQFIIDHWGSTTAVAHGEVYHPHTLPGFVAIQQEEHVGLITYSIKQDSCEIVTIDSLRPSSGIGTALIEAVKEVAHKNQCKRLWLITTNDNINALRFYQKGGFTLAALHKNALEYSRKLKPEIPLIGQYGIPLRDEIELEMMLEAGATANSSPSWA